MLEEYYKQDWKLVPKKWQQWWYIYNIWYGYNQVGTDWTADPSRSCGRCRAELGRIINRGAVCRSALINNPATKMINLQGLQYPSLQELSRFLPGPGLALPGLQEKQVSLSSQNLKVKSGALIWYIYYTSHTYYETKVGGEKSWKRAITVIASQSEEAKREKWWQRFARCNDDRCCPNLLSAAE